MKWNHCLRKFTLFNIILIVCIIAANLANISQQFQLLSTYIGSQAKLNYFNTNYNGNINLKQQMHNISIMINNRYDHFKIILLNIVIDDRNATNPKLKLFGTMPYQLLPETFWIHN
eukprot:533522_1